MADRETQMRELLRFVEDVYHNLDQFKPDFLDKHQLWGLRDRANELLGSIKV